MLFLSGFWALFSLGAPAPKTVPNARHHAKEEKETGAKIAC